MQRARVHVISAPSSGGKSTFIATLAGTYDRVVFPPELDALELEHGRSYLLHYNLLRPYERHARIAAGRSLERKLRGAALALRMRWSNPFDLDPALRRLTELDAELRATVLVAPREVIAARMRERDEVERLAEGAGAYPREKWLEILARVDLAAVHRDWIAFLERERVPYELLSSADACYAKLASLDEALKAFA